MQKIRDSRFSSCYDKEKAMQGGSTMKLSTVRRLTYMLLALICVMLVLVWYLDVYELVYSAVTLVVLVGIVNRLFWKCPHCGKTFEK